MECACSMCLVYGCGAIIQSCQPFDFEAFKMSGKKTARKLQTQQQQKEST